MNPKKAGAAEALRVLHLQFTVAIFQPFVSKSCDFPAGATSVLKKCDFPAGAAAASAYCDFPAGAAGARSAYYVCT